MSQAEDPSRLLRKEGANEVTVEDVRQLMGASTPHFALQLRNRIANLIAGLPADHPARLEGEREIARLERLGFSGETRGEGEPRASAPLPSLDCRRSTPAEPDRPERRLSAAGERPLAPGSAKRARSRLKQDTPAPTSTASSTRSSSAPAVVEHDQTTPV